MIGLELRQGEAGAVALVGSQRVLVGLACHFQSLAHGDAGDIGQLLGLWEHIRDGQVVVPILQADELHYFVQLAFLMLLGLGVHIRGAHSHQRSAAVADFLAVLVELLAQGLSQELDVPLGHGLEVVAIESP